MNGLHHHAEHQLHPEIPVPRQIGRHVASRDGTHDRATDRRQHDESNGVLLLIRLPHIGHHSQRDRATGRGQSTQEASDDDGRKVGGQRAGDLPEVDEEQTELQDRSSSQLLTPRGPELASERVGDQKDHLSDAGRLQGDAEFLCHRLDGAGVDAGVEVHGDLDREDDAQDPPFPRGRERKSEFVVAVPFRQHDFPVPGVATENGTHDIFGLDARIRAG